jgi:polyhydroxybutyrate depolymerase
MKRIPLLHASRSSLVLLPFLASGCLAAGTENNGDGDGDSAQGDGDGDGIGSGGDNSSTGGSNYIPGVGGESVGVGGTATGGYGTGGEVVNEQTGGAPSGGSDGGEATGGTQGGYVPDPSPGCSLGSQSVSVDNAIVGKPTGYDGSTPVPVIFAFHAANNPNTQLQDRFGNTPVGQKHLMIYLKSTGSGWTMQADKSRFNTAMTQVMNNACVDRNKVYALGHSSGAQFIVQLLCDGESRFDAVVPIASSVYCNSWNAVPTLNIHGVDDDERWAYGLNDGDGKKDIVPYRTSNGCQSTSVPADLTTNGCGGNITPGCVEFQGCSEPTFWCNHNDPQYGTSNHGIPCFAVSAVDDFLSRL